MRLIITLLTFILISSISYAEEPTTVNHTASMLHALSTAWKNYSSFVPVQRKNDIAMVYGGADISRRPTLASHTTVA